MFILETIVRHFERIQFGFIALAAIAVFFFLLNRKPVSGFKVREADRDDLERLLKKGNDLGNSRIQRKNTPTPPPPLQLPGIRLTGEPHEILGVRADATEEEILKAYKDAIKRFHPDTIQGPAQEQLEFYQRASAAINTAKNLMIKKSRGR